MEFRSMPQEKKKVRAVLFDFDGTISTLRYDWEEVMEPMMTEILTACGRESREEIQALVCAYIDESTGIQTVYQMKWLAEEVQKRGGSTLSPWDYKAEYNRRLMQRIEIKKQALTLGTEKPEQYLMEGALRFLTQLRQRGARVYAASGTDHPDVLEEAKLLAVYDCFDEMAGAPLNQENCSKEAVLRQLMETYGLRGNEVAVIGDGKVEIMLGKAAGALTIGLASDEAKRHGVNEVKRQRLIKAGADVIIGDFSETDALLGLLGL